jgi:hypothetical protein
VIRLTRPGPHHIFVDPAYLTQIVDGESTIDTFIVMLNDPDVIIVEESPLDIARLKAAWAERFHAPELAQELPIAVYMDRTEGRPPGIQFLCCQITHDLMEERRLEAQRLEEQFRANTPNAPAPTGADGKPLRAGKPLMSVSSPVNSIWRRLLSSNSYKSR